MPSQPPRRPSPCAEVFVWARCVAVLAAMASGATAQDGCAYLVHPLSDVSPHYGGVDEIYVEPSDCDCPWTAESMDDWIEILSGESGVGAGTVRYRVTANPGPGDLRTGNIQVAGQTVRVRQRTFCGFSAVPMRLVLRTGANPDQLSVAGPACTFQFVSESWYPVPPWFNLLQSTGTTLSPVSYFVPPNTGEARSGLLIIDGNSSADEAYIYIFQQGQTTGLDVVALAPGGAIWRARNERGVFNLARPAAETGYRHDPAAGWQTLAGDLNGDGRTDIFCLTEYGHLWRVLAVGDGTFGPNENVAAPGFLIDSTTGRMAFVADADGDGFDDLAHVALDGLSLLANNAGTFAAPARIGDGIAYDPTAGHEILVGNFDGTPGEELLAFDPDGAATLVPLDGSPRIPFGSIGVSSAAPPPGITCDGIQLLAGDFDGDGKTDVVAITETAFLRALSTGTALAPPVALATSGFHFAPYRGKGWTVFAADTSGDGRDDLVQLNEWGYFWTVRSTGTGFAPPFINAITGFEHRAEGPWQTFFGNFND